MRLKLIQLRCRPAMRRPVDASLDPATRGTAKSGKSHRDQAEKRRHATIPVVLHPTNVTAAWARRPPSGMVPGLGDDDLLLDARQQPLRLGQGQTQIGDILEIVRPINLHNIHASPITLSPGFHHLHNPGHASTPGSENRRENTAAAGYTPKL